MTAPPISREQWYRLPKYLRIKWWTETRFDRLPPSPDLLAEVNAALTDRSYPCAVCGTNRLPWAEVADGYDTCTTCQPRRTR